MEKEPKLNIEKKIEPNNVFYSVKKQYEEIEPNLRKELENSLKEDEILERIRFYKETAENNKLLAEDLKDLTNDEIRQFVIWDLIVIKASEYGMEQYEKRTGGKAEEKLLKSIFGEKSKKYEK